MLYGIPVEVTIESRSKTIYEISVSPDDFEVQWEFTLDSHDVIFGASFARASNTSKHNWLARVFAGSLATPVCCRDGNASPRVALVCSGGWQPDACDQGLGSEEV
jgi:hypothetical protein